MLNKHSTLTASSMSNAPYNNYWHYENKTIECASEKKLVEMASIGSSDL